MLCSSVLAFTAGQAVPSGLKTYLHPVFSSVIGTWLAAAAWAAYSGRTFLGVLTTYGTWPGAGTLLSFMLGPAIVCLALLLYERRELLGRELVPIGLVSVVSGALSLFLTAVLARAFALPHALALCTLPRNVTSAIAIDIARLFGGSTAFTVAIVVFTGFLGVAFGQPYFRAAKVKSPRARGLAMAASAHGLGTVSLAGTDKEAFAYSSVGFVVVAAGISMIVQVPQIRALLLALVP